MTFIAALYSVKIYGNPVSVTGYSSTDNPIPIPYKATPTNHREVDGTSYVHITSWADPDIDTAFIALQRLYNDKKLRRKLWQNTSLHIKRFFSTENFQKNLI